MKKYDNSVLHSKKGETLIESIISIVIFAILMVAITSLTTNSLRIAKDSTVQGELLQQTVNSAVDGTLPTTDTAVVTFKNISAGIDASVSVDIAEKDGLVVFYPKVTP